MSAPRTRRRSERLANKSLSNSVSNPITSSTSTTDTKQCHTDSPIPIHAPELDGKYQLLEKIDYGGYAIVYKARDLRTNQYVAIKRVQTAQINMKYAFTDNHPCIECKVLVELSDEPYFPTIHQVLVDKSSGSFSIVMNYFPHKRFNQYITTLNESQTIEYIQVLLQSINTLSENGYVHRDIKPGNFLFNPLAERKRDRYMLIDFGLVQLQSAILREYQKEIKEVKSRRSTIQIPKSCRPPTRTRAVTNSLRSRKSTKSTKSTKKNRRKKRMSDFHIGPAALMKDKVLPKAIRNGTPGWRAPEVILRSNYQDSRIDTFNAGLLLGCIMMGCTSIYCPKDDMHQLLQYIAVYGLHTVRDTADALNRKLRIEGLERDHIYFNDTEDGTNSGTYVTGFEYAVQAKAKLSYWIKRRIQCLKDVDGKENVNNFNVNGMRMREWSEDLYDLLDGLTEFNPNHRLTPSEALQHRVFQK